MHNYQVGLEAYNLASVCISISSLNVPTAKDFATLVRLIIIFFNEHVLEFYKDVTEKSSQGCHHYGLLGSVHGLNTTYPT